jgi:hypothetical protein
VIPEIDIWSAANLMLKRYGTKALEESTARADELAVQDDHNGAAVWRRITDAVGQLAGATPAIQRDEPDRAAEKLERLGTIFEKRLEIFRALGPGSLVRDQHKPRQLFMHIVTGLCEAVARHNPLQIMRDLDEAEFDQCIDRFGSNGRHGD